MTSRTLCVLWLAATLSVSAASAVGAPAPAPAPTSGGIRISITNVYRTKLDFGVLGTGSRTGTDRVEGMLKRQGREYVGIVDAFVSSTQGLAGLAGTCGPARYEDSQKLRVTGRSVGGFNSLVQSVTFNAGRLSNDYLLLEFVPETRTRLQPQNPDPGQDQVVSCHTLIETEATARSGILFLPLNDSRWTLKGGGYIVALPSSGVIKYTDETVNTTGGAQIGPFSDTQSAWTIEIERLP